MSSDRSFEVQALKTPSYPVKQPRYSNLMALPARIVCCSPSGGGKSTAVVNLLTDGFRGCFSAIYVFSHSIHIDPSWLPVKKMIQDMKTGACYDTFEDSTLQEIYDEHAAVVAYQKGLKDKPKYIHSICIVADDLIDNPRLRHSRSFETLAIRGRHSGATLLCTCQKLKYLAPVLRVNFSDWLIWSLNSRTELQHILEENSAIMPIDKLYQLFEKATREKYSFLWINKRDRTFHTQFGPPEN